MADTKQIGTELAQLIEQGKNAQAIESFYADDIVSVEAMGGGGFDREARGKQDILGKNKWWAENHEVHDASVEGPFPHGDDRFALRLQMDVTHKPSGQRMTFNEIAVYEVKNGKIAREEFYYDM